MRRSLFDHLYQELDHVRETFSDPCVDLPTSLVHPDFVPVNVIVSKGSEDSEDEKEIGLWSTGRARV
jgi:aminoglycoside/choline kinase family phosphotransferase